MQSQSQIWCKKKSGLLIIVLTGLFVAVTLTYAIKLGEVLRYPDETEYLSLARNLVATGHYTLDGTTPTAYRPPAYPFLLAVGLKLGLSVTELRVVNASTLLASMALLYTLLRKSSVTQATIAVLLVMSYPVLLYTASTFYPQIPAAAVFLSALLILFSNANPGKLRFLFAGALLGITILLVPTFVFTLLFTSAFFAFRTSRVSGARNVAIMLIGATLILTPWIARNALVFGRFIPISTNNGISLLTGNNEHSTANSGVTPSLAQYLTATKGLNEIEADEYYRHTALEFMRNHPGATFTLYLKKTANYFNFHNQLATQSESSPTRDLIMFLTYGFLLAAAVTRICLRSRYPLSGLERYSVYLYLLNGLFSAIFFTRIRFRLPMDFLLIVLASSAIALVINQHIKRTGSIGARK